MGRLHADAEALDANDLQDADDVRLSVPQHHRTRRQLPGETDQGPEAARIDEGQVAQVQYHPGAAVEVRRDACGEVIGRQDVELAGQVIDAVRSLQTEAHVPPPGSDIGARRDVVSSGGVRLFGSRHEGSRRDNRATVADVRCAGWPPCLR